MSRARVPVSHCAEICVQLFALIAENTGVVSGAFDGVKVNDKDSVFKELQSRKGCCDRVRPNRLLPILELHTTVDLFASTSVGDAGGIQLGIVE